MSKVFRSARTISLLTLASRVLGLARDVLSARIFGTGLVYDAFLLAFTIPNLFRRLFGEGALSAAFIPVYAGYLEAGDEGDIRAFRSSVFSVLLAVLAAIAACGAVAGAAVPSLVHLPERWRATFELLPVMMVYVVPVCLTAFLGAVLNSHGHFVMPALAPVVMNAFWIGGLAVFYVAPVSLARLAFVLAAAIVVSGAAQLAIQFPALGRRGIRVRFRPDFSHPGVRSVRTLMAPAVFGLAVVQINTLLDRVIAMALVGDPGGVSALFFADRLIEFPLALVGIAVATAVFPTLSRLAAGGENDRFALTFKETVLGVLYIAVPAAVGIGVLAVPLVRLLFEHGKFDSSSTGRTSLALACYAATVACASVYHVVARTFYSLKDTRTPVRVGAAMVALNLALNLSLVGPLREAGLALATSVSSAANVLVLLSILGKRLPVLDLAGLARGLARFAAMSGVMAAAVLGTLHLMPGEGAFALRLSRVALPVGVGMLTVALFSILFRFPEFSFIAASLRRRRG